MAPRPQGGGVTGPEKSRLPASPLPLAPGRPRRCRELQAEVSERLSPDIPEGVCRRPARFFRRGKGVLGKEPSSGARHCPCAQGHLLRARGHGCVQLSGLLVTAGFLEPSALLDA